MKKNSMLKWSAYYYKHEDDKKMSLDWFKYEDHWSQRYMFDRPMWNDEMMESMRLSNLNRHVWFTIRLELFSYKMSLDIRLKHIGNVYHGRKMEDVPKASPFRKRKEDA